MKHSIFDLYDPSAASNVKAKAQHPYVYKRTPAAQDSPDSIQWDEESHSPRHSILENIAENSTPQLMTNCSLPAIHIEHEDTKTQHARNSFYGPIRFWPKAYRASRCFEEVYSYESNQAIWKHFKPYAQHMASTDATPSSLLALPKATLHPPGLKKRQSSVAESGVSPSPGERSPANLKKLPKMQKKPGHKRKTPSVGQPLRLQPLPQQSKPTFTQASSMVLQHTRKIHLRHTLDF